MIKFGTDGWRAVISDQLTFENVRIVAQAVADYVLEMAGSGPVVAVGYDTRFMSDLYARECAVVLAGNGIRVLLADCVTATPALSYAVRNRGAAGAIMVTASHNPYQYNGIKFKAAYGGSALPDIISRIESKLRLRQPVVMPFDQALDGGRITYFNCQEEYFEQVRRLVDLPKIARGGLQVIIDPMHGAGAGYIKSLLGPAGLEIREIRGDRSPLFGGVNPEPIQKNLAALVDAVTQAKAAAGFATDGDADRVGVVGANGEFINSHIIYALLMRYLISRRKWTGGVVKTFSTSQMIDKLADKYKIPVYETPIGFKYICELFLQQDILLGGEESGGIGFKNHIPERDGILSSLLLMEMMVTYGKTLDEIIAEMMQEIGQHSYDRIDLHLSPAAKEKALATLAGYRPEEFAGIRVKEVLTLDGVKLMLADGSWILFRASGTEPVVRVYAEAAEAAGVQRLLTEGQRLLGLS